MLENKRKWINDVSSQTKLENYKTVKNEFGAEEYVKLVMGKLEKVSMGHGCPRLLFLFHLQLNLGIQ